jgi:prevent-host-death family protein
MERVSLLEFRRHASAIIRKVQLGKRLLLTHRGKPVMRLEPIQSNKVSPDDPFYGIARFAADGGPLTNAEIDQIVYDV